MVKSIRELPPNPFSGWNPSKILSNNVLASHSVGGHELAFLRIPPLTARKAVEGWSVPPFPFKPFDFTAHTPENILAVAELRGQ
jgi:hypothetical protein